MTTISAKVIADSVAPGGSRLTTLQLRYPRWIHAEFMTHRVFSRNASSSRAIPVAKLIDDVKRDPAVPLFWGKNQKGMQADEECNERVNFPYVEHTTGVSREDAWLSAMRYAIEATKEFDAAGYHKQLVNRLLEPFSHINVVVSATAWDNFFALRDHKDAEPHIRMLAQEMRKAMDASTPRKLNLGDWHLPYMDGEATVYNPGIYFPGSPEKCSAARCARVSYLTYEGKKPEVMADLALFRSLVGSNPAHASPLEHQAYPSYSGPNNLCGNFHNSWVQHRKLLRL